MRTELEQLKQIYENILLSTHNSRKIPQIEVKFYPYVGINNKIRLRDDVIQVKLSDILQDAPIEIHQSLAEILLKKLYRKRLSTKTLEVYRDYVKQSEIREKSIESRKTRGRKILNGSQGENYDLDEIFNLLNQIYFQNTISKPTLTWSAKDTYRILGHHDPTHNTITISKTLDDKSVPRFVVECVVYHEMLHIKHPTRFENGRRYSHTPEFKRDEREFAFFAESEAWIEKHWGEFSQGKRQKVKSKKGFFRKLLDF